MGEACRVFETPVTGGNVSFYNEDPDRAVYPTPTIGMIGLIDDIAYITTQRFKNVGDLIFLVGSSREDLGASEYVKTIHGKITGDAPYLNLDEEKRIQQFILAAIRAGLVNSAHDVSDGGLAVCLAECCITNPDALFGCTVNFPQDGRPDAIWFGEAQSRAVLSVPPEKRARLETLAVEQAVPLAILGEVTTGKMEIDDRYRLEAKALREAYYTCLPKLMERTG
jgi:phosphoribosylformylglycinamidine synthase